MQTKHLCVLIHIIIKGEVGTVKLIKALQYFSYTGRSKAVFILWILYFICLCHTVMPFFAVLWSPVEKGLTF